MRSSKILFKAYQSRVIRLEMEHLLSLVRSITSFLSLKSSCTFTRGLPLWNEWNKRSKFKVRNNYVFLIPEGSDLVAREISDGQIWRDKHSCI